MGCNAVIPSGERTVSRQTAKNIKLHSDHSFWDWLCGAVVSASLHQTVERLGGGAVSLILTVGVCQSNAVFLHNNTNQRFSLWIVIPGKSIWHLKRNFMNYKSCKIIKLHHILPNSQSDNITAYKANYGIITPQSLDLYGILFY